MSPKWVIALFVLVGILFAVGLTVGVTRNDDSKYPSGAGALTKFKGLLYPLTPRAVLKETTFTSGQEVIDDQAVDSKKTPFRMIKFYLVPPDCAFEITYTPPPGKGSDLGSSGPPKPLRIPADTSNPPEVREGIVTLLAPGGKLRFWCTTHGARRNSKPCAVTTTVPVKK